jgi:hypothetical protein
MSENKSVKKYNFFEVENQFKGCEFKKKTNINLQETKIAENIPKDLIKSATVAFAFLQSRLPLDTCYVVMDSFSSAFGNGPTQLLSIPKIVMKSSIDLNGISLGIGSSSSAFSSLISKILSFFDYAFLKKLSWSGLVGLIFGALEGYVEETSFLSEKSKKNWISGLKNLSLIISM